MNAISRPALLGILFLALASLTAAQGDAPSMRRAQSLFDRGKWKEAAEAFEKITAVEPDNGQAWFRLAFSRHELKDWVGAAEANGHAARFPTYRATALYNMTCAQSLGGNLEEAEASLASAVEAGFLDFDLIATDADLAALRDKGGIEMPPVRTYREKKARGGILMRYAVVEPAGYDSGKEYPVLVAFAPGVGTRAADWMMQALWERAGEQTEWIVVCLVAPEERGWFTHPSHHALEDLLRSLQKEYQVKGERFHLFGYASACRPALTYSGMSKKYFQSMTLVSSAAWSSYDDGDMARWKKMPIHQIVGAESHTLAADRDAHERLLQKGVRSSLTVVPEDGLLVRSLAGVDLLAAIAQAHLRD